jgi:hypothetical protein
MKSFEKEYGGQVSVQEKTLVQVNTFILHDEIQKIKQEIRDLQANTLITIAMWVITLAIIFILHVT